jgi:hypothetical protein
MDGPFQGCDDLEQLVLIEEELGKLLAEGGIAPQPFLGFRYGTLVDCLVIGA